MKTKLKIYNFGVYLISGVIEPFIAAYLYHRAFGGVQIGLMLGTLPLALMVFQPIWSYLSDILHARRILLQIACLGAGVSLVGLGLVDSFFATFLLGLVLVFFRSPIVVITNAITLDYLEKESSIEDFSLIRLWGSVSFAISSFILGSYVVENNMDIFPWLAAGLFFLQAAISFLLPKEAKAVRFSGLKDVRLAENNNPLIWFLVAIVFIGATASISINYQTIYLQSLQADAWLIGLIIGLQAILEVPFMLIAPAVLKRVSMEKLILFGALLLPIRWISYIFIDNPYWVIPTQLLHSIATVCLIVVGAAFIDTKVAKQWRATGQGLYTTAMFSVGASLGQYLAGSVYQAFHIQAVWGLSLVLGVIGIVLLVMSLRKFNKATPPEPGTASEAI
ncbi:MAG: MFS transporter [Chloroflexota bacterium]|nr:MFS transporter [Chloroflexota bacterium]